ncbi:DUF883 family protein [Robiginitomaculum antarcticum]|uniref:DUF883 family protein n=1 Tax=Robiginitomaculum antarcticum TaxID=437507 RepID=UPI00036F08E5|nr:DUF883 family protein [Robiginitomaculum antarcticum]
MATTKATTATAKKNVVALKDPEISTQIETLRSDIALLAKTMKEQAKSTASQKVTTAKQVASDTSENVKVKYNELTTQAEASIRENPLTSIAIAVGAGIVLGALTRR